MRPGKRPFRPGSFSATKRQDARPLLKMAEPFESDHACSPMNATVCDLLRAETRSNHVTSRIGSIARRQIVSVSFAGARLSTKVEY